MLTLQYFRRKLIKFLSQKRLNDTISRKTFLTRTLYLYSKVTWAGTD